MAFDTNYVVSRRTEETTNSLTFKARAPSLKLSPVLQPCARAARCFGQSALCTGSSGCFQSSSSGTEQLGSCTVHRRVMHSCSLLSVRVTCDEWQIRNHPRHVVACYITFGFKTLQYHIFFRAIRVEQVPRFRGGKVQIVIFTVILWNGVLLQSLSQSPLWTRLLQARNPWMENERTNV